MRLPRTGSYNSYGNFDHRYATGIGRSFEQMLADFNRRQGSSVFGSYDNYGSNTWF